MLERVQGKENTVHSLQNGTTPGVGGPSVSMLLSLGDKTEFLEKERKSERERRHGDTR